MTFRAAQALLKSYRGTSEQYASAFALLCRHLGWDTRVVLGFRPEWTGNRVSIDGSNVFAWVEVRFARLGWVPIDPSPTQTASDDTPGKQEERQAGSFPTVPTPPQHAPSEPGSSTETPPLTSPPGAVPWWSAAALLLLLIPVPLKALRLRRDRTTGTPRRRIACAWRHTVDVLRATGHAVDHTSTTGQVVACIETAQPLAHLVDRALFAPGMLGDDDAVLAWECADSLRTTVLIGVPRWTRLRFAFDPRPLLPVRRPREYGVDQLGVAMSP